MRTNTLHLRPQFAAGVILSIVTVSAITNSLRAQDKPPAKTVIPTTVVKPTFEKVGPQVGEQLPDLRLRNLKGEPQHLSDDWRGGPALVVTSSLTCPKSRSRWPELAAIAKKYGEKLNIVVVYVIEAHPVGSACPYKGVEDVTPENERDGILRRQPQTLEDRLELAQEFKRYLRVEVPIHVDAIDNRAWKAFGAAPNIAYLVDEDAIVVARQGWFDGPSLQKAIDVYLANPPASRDEKRDQDWQERRDLGDRLSDQLSKADLHPANLIFAVKGDKADELNKLLKRVPGGANFLFSANEFHPHETTWLMEAVSAGNVSAAETLIKAGADAKARTSSFDSPLQLAAQVGNVEMVNLLLRHKADVNYPPAGKTPIHEAILAGHADIAKLLIDSGGKDDFYSHIGLGKAAAVRESLAVDPSRASRPDGEKRTPLDYAAASGQLEIAKMLLDAGAFIVDYDHSFTKVPLHYAIHASSAPMVDLLLKAGSSPNTALSWREHSEPALHMTIERDQVEIVKLLLAHNPDLKSRNTYSQMPLHFAAELGKDRIAELLIKAGADVKATTIAFETPCGDPFEERIPQHNTPLHFAAAAGNPATIKVLIAGGADIDATNVKGLTPLMSTLNPPIYTPINEKSRLANIELLLASGANVNAGEKQGPTMLDMAEGLGNPDIVKLLTKQGAKHGPAKPKSKADTTERSDAFGGAEPKTKTPDSSDPFGGGR